VPTMGAFSSLVILMSLNRPSRSDSKVDKEVRTLSRHVRVNEPLGSSYKTHKKIHKLYQYLESYKDPKLS
jgi:hypothetical protein